MSSFISYFGKEYSINLKIIRSLALLYLLLPFVLFLLFYLNVWIGWPLFVFTSYIYYRFCKTHQIDNIISVNFISLLAIVAFSFLVCFFCGIGSFWSQTGDFWVKNTILRDLVNREWPLIYDLSEQSDYVQTQIGQDKVAFVYYFFYYLPAGLIGKLFGLFYARIALLLWSVIGLFLVIVSLLFSVNAKLQNIKKICLILFLFYAFGGLDIIGDLIHNNTIGSDWWQKVYLNGFVEAWCTDYTALFVYYAGNITDLNWCFNQCIPLWLIMSLIISSRVNGNIPLLASLSVLYSPWASITLFAFAVLLFLSKPVKHIMVSYFDIVNIIFMILLAIVILSFYYSRQGEPMESGWWCEYYKIKQFLYRYILFITIELGVYCVFLRREILHDRYLLSSLICLLVLPLYKLSNYNDLLMRGSIPMLFIFCVYWIRYIVHLKKSSITIFLFLIISFLAQSQLFCNKMFKIIETKEIHLSERSESFNYLNDKNFYVVDKQFFGHNFSDTFFWNYLAKH